MKSHRHRQHHQPGQHTHRSILHGLFRMQARTPCERITVRPAQTAHWQNSGKLRSRTATDLLSILGSKRSFAEAGRYVNRRIV
jgi:hypothetical protein